MTPTPPPPRFASGGGVWRDFAPIPDLPEERARGFIIPPRRADPAGGRFAAEVTVAGISARFRFSMPFQVCHWQCPPPRLMMRHHSRARRARIRRGGTNLPHPSSDHDADGTCRRSCRAAACQSRPALSDWQQWQAPGPLSYYALQMHPQPQTQAESGPLRELEAA
jgi:hypothetical protein